MRKIIVLITLLFVIIMTYLYIISNEPGRSHDSRITTYINRLRNSLELYIVENDEYPESVQLLLPSFIESLEFQRTDGSYPYTYERLNSKEYKICIDYEKQPDECIYSP